MSSGLVRPVILASDSSSMGDEAPRTMADRLAQLRRARFVGRTAELDGFAAMLDGRDPRPVMFVYGPGGIGKSALLAEFARLAEAAGRAVVSLDARDVEPSPAGFRAAVREALGGEELPERAVLLLDTLERVGQLERWLLTHHLPSLPADALVILAGRQAPGALWRLDPGWAELAQQTALAGLDRSDALALLSARGVAIGLRDRATALARGNPLALTLLADALRAGRHEVLSSPDERRGLMRSLADHFIAELPSAAHERALQVLMLARATTESMIADAVDSAAASSLYAWLRTLSFVEAGEHGLVPHDLVREALEAEWFARDAANLEPLRVALMQHLQRRLQRLGDGELTAIARDWTYLARGTPVWRFLDWTKFDRFHTDHAAAHEHGDILAQVGAALGPESASIAEHWLRRQPEGAVVTRDLQGRVAGVRLDLDLSRVDADDRTRDPVVERAMAWVETHRPLVPGLRATLTRFGVHEGRCEAMNPTFDLGVLDATKQYLGCTQLAWTFVVWPEAERFEPLFNGLRRYHWHRREPGLDAMIDGRIFGAFVRDWRQEPNPLWGTGVPGSTVIDAASVGPGRPSPIARDEFAAAIRDALKHFTRDDRLAASRLLDTDLVRTCIAAPVDALREVLREAVDALAVHPRDEKFHHALRLTWLDPGATQESVAHELGLPFNTYRYHLAKGLERVVEALWQRELSAGRRAE